MIGCVCNPSRAGFGAENAWERENAGLRRIEGRAMIEEDPVTQNTLVPNIEVEETGDIGETADHIEMQSHKCNVYVLSVMTGTA